MVGVAIQNFTRRTSAPRASFAAIATYILPTWDISLAFLGAKRARSLNKRLRGKTYVPNVLSYAVGNKHGEVCICLEEASKQAPRYGLSSRAFTLYLFIHGLLHLKGGVHGATMERRERVLLATFVKSSERSLPYGTTHRNRHRHRHVPGQNGRRRGTLR